MKETPAQIQATLLAAGELLTFPTFTMYGLPGFDTSILIKGEYSSYEIERQNFSFEVSIADCKTHSVVMDNTFTMTDGSYTYSFKIDRPFIPDLTGWAHLAVNLISKTAI